MRKLDGRRWQREENSTALCLLAKHFLANYLSVFYTFEVKMKLALQELRGLSDYLEETLDVNLEIMKFVWINI